MPRKPVIEPVQPQSAPEPNFIAMLRAGNPDYNESLQSARQFREQLAGLGLRMNLLGAIPTVTGPFNADLLTEEDLDRGKVDATTPINLQCRFEGRDDFHNVGLLRRMLRPGTPAAFRSVFANIYGAADTSGRSATDLLLALPAVNEALQNYLKQA